jgi:hypothetical protein
MVMGLISCQSHSSLIQVSDFTVINQDTTMLWILDDSTGKNLFRVWNTGIYGSKTEVHLIDSVTFKSLVNKSINTKKPSPSVSMNP